MARQLTIDLELDMERVVIEKEYVAAFYVWRKVDTGVVYARQEVRWWKQLPPPANHPITGAVVPNPPTWIQMTASRKTSVENWWAEMLARGDTLPIP